VGTGSWATCPGGGTALLSETTPVRVLTATGRQPDPVGSGVDRALE
jgi:hypothetical protein